MTIEIHPSGLTCNLRCSYCYQEGMRDMTDNKSEPLQIETAKTALEKENGAFTMFGGEILVTPLPVLEDLFTFGLQRWGKNNIQTNGTLVTPAHLDLFRRYKVHVGISVDGPPELNRSRWAGSESATDRLSHRTEETIFTVLADPKLSMSLIVVLHQRNASKENLPILMDWFRTLMNKGLANLDLHLMEVNSSDAADYELTDEENIWALRELKILEHEGLKIKLFEDFRRALLREEGKNPNCIWNACDPVSTRAVRGVDVDGSAINCGRVNKDGVNWLKGDPYVPLRTQLLYQTPQTSFGCKDCRFFFACAGNCPGGAVDGDWRNRSKNCLVWYTMLEDTEKELLDQGKTPISRDTKRMEAAEERLLSPDHNGDHGDSHGDGYVLHGDAHADSDSTRIHSMQLPIGKPAGV